MTTIDKDSTRYVVAVAVLHIAALSLPILSPLIIGGIITSLGAGEVEVGLLITVELLVMGGVSIAMAPVTVRFPAHLIALVGGVIIIVGYYLSSTAQVFNDLYPWRILSGVGNGILISINYAVAARGKRPAFLYGIGWMSVYIFTAAFAILITSLNDQLHHAIVYRWLSIAMVLVLPFYFLLPKTTAESVSLKLPEGTLLTGSALMIGILLVGSGMMAYYAFLERISMSINGNTAHAGVIIALAQVGGIVGAGLAVLASNRYGLLRPLLVITGVHAICLSVATFTSSIYLLGIAAFAEAVAFIMYTPLVNGLVAEVDRQGRWAAIAAGVFVISTGIGPVVGGVVAESTGYATLGVLNIIVAIPAIFLFLWVGKRVFQSK